MNTQHLPYIEFILNGQNIQLKGFDAELTLLDYLRGDKNLTGTKEGCAEGDCGACTVLIGQLVDGGLVYDAVDSCIRFMASLNACHIVTVEHLKKPNGDLHPVQQAMVNYHGSQCGFCTPGVVMSLYGLWMENSAPSRTEIETSLQGDLCRCTGYQPIIKAAENIVGDNNNDLLKLERAQTVMRLEKMSNQSRIVKHNDIVQAYIPKDCDELAKIIEAEPEVRFIAGATDIGLWTTKHMRKIAPAVFTNHLSSLKKVEMVEGGIFIGAGVTFDGAEQALYKFIPWVKPFWSRIAGQQIRNMGTIGGNIANGSPIGDTPPLLIALEGEVILRKGKHCRQIKLEDYFLAYGKQDIKPGEFIEKLYIPTPAKKAKVSIYKITKRFDEDISAVCAAINLSVDNDGLVSDVKIVFGGMAGIPKRAKNVENALHGKPFTKTNIELAQKAIELDFKPLSDWRASANYRTLVAKNLLLRFYLEHTENSEVYQLPSRQEVLEGRPL